MSVVSSLGSRFVYVSRAAFVARRFLAKEQRRVERGPITSGRRNILFITSDQQRHDSLGVTGHRYAQTPALDRLAREGILFRNAYVQNVVCQPSRTTMLTGQYPLTHGVVANGISMPDDVPNVAELLRRSGYRTALIGKAHFDPHFDPLLRFSENRLAAEGSNGPWRGFEHVELATHGPIGGHHYADWLWRHHPDEIAGFATVLSGAGGGETGAPEVKHNPIPREHYHTDWLADRAIEWMRASDGPFFCWLSFPDPHHPFDPPRSEIEKRARDFRDRTLPEAYPGSAERIRSILSKKPRHWLDWYDGRFTNPEGGPTAFRPSELSHDQLREIDAIIQVENELIDEACGRVMTFLEERGLAEDTDVFFTSDHGDLQGDFGLLFKGPYHVDSLLRVPLIWKPAPSAGVTPFESRALVGHVDLAPTFCAIAGIDAPAEMQGEALPVDATSRGHERLIVSNDSQFAAVGMHLRTIVRDGVVCTAYEKSTRDAGGRFPIVWRIWGRGSVIPRYDGTEGELYETHDDPRQWENRWDDPSRRRKRHELVAELREHMPPARAIALPVVAPT